MTVPLLPPATITILFIGYTPIQNKKVLRDSFEKTDKLFHGEKNKSSLLT